MSIILVIANGVLVYLIGKILVAILVDEVIDGGTYAFYNGISIKLEFCVVSIIHKIGIVFYGSTKRVRKSLQSILRDTILRDGAAGIAQGLDTREGFCTGS